MISNYTIEYKVVPSGHGWAEVSAVATLWNDPATPVLAWCEYQTATNGGAWDAQCEAMAKVEAAIERWEEGTGLLLHGEAQKYMEA